MLEPMTERSSLAFVVEGLNAFKWAEPKKSIRLVTGDIMRAPNFHVIKVHLEFVSAATETMARISNIPQFCFSLS